MPLKDKQAYNKYMRVKILKRYHERRTKALEYLGGKCIICETTENLNFDHIDRMTKAFSISKMWSLAEQTFWNEIRKCQILCFDCHLQKTLKSKDWAAKNPL